MFNFIMFNYMFNTNGHPINKFPDGTIDRMWISWIG